MSRYSVWDCFSLSHTGWTVCPMSNQTSWGGAVRESLESHYTHTDFNQVFREAHDIWPHKTKNRSLPLDSSFEQSAPNENRPTLHAPHHSVPRVNLYIHSSTFKAVTFVSSLSDAGMLWHLMLLKVRPLHAKIRNINFSPQRWKCYSQGLSYDTETTTQ